MYIHKRCYISIFILKYFVKLCTHRPSDYRENKKKNVKLHSKDYSSSLDSRGGIQEGEELMFE